MVNISEIKEFSRKLRLLYLENPEVQRNIDAALVYLDLAVHAAEHSAHPTLPTSGENSATWVIDPNNITPPAISG